MSTTPRLIGTLIVVVLKARNLPNKRHIGKQDPYCTLKLHADTKRTKAIKRGGQHPEWDEEIRFELFEDVEDELARTARGRREDGATPPLPPPKDPKERKIKGGKTMRLLCYADDPREPELIGETVVDLNEVLKKGETDEWYTLLNKDKYSGEIYLELTFWSNDKPPEKKHAEKPSNLHPQYGGPGSFTPSNGLGHGGRNSSGGSSPSGGDRTPYHDRQGSVPGGGSQQVPSSSSLAQINLYIPPYDQSPPHHPKKYDPSMEFGDQARRRESYPPPGSRPQSNYGYQGVNYGTPANPNPYDTVAAVVEPYTNGSPSSYYQSSQSQAFTNSLFQANPPVASGFAPPQPTMTPHPSGFQPIYPGYNAPRPAATPMPAFVPPQSAMGFHGYQTPAPSGFAPQTPHPPAFQHHPNSYPAAVPPANSAISGLPYTGSIPSTPAPHPQYGVPIQQQQPVQYQQQAQMGQGRPLPDQPPQQQNNLPAPGFPAAQPYNHGQVQPQLGQTNVGQPVNSGVPAPVATPGFIPPPPPPPINNQPHRASSLPPVPGGANSSLPIPPQQPPQQNAVGTASTNNTGGSGSGRPGLPLPPLPNPPGQVQSAFYTGPPAASTTPLPGPPPSLRPGGNGFVPQQQQQQQQQQQTLSPQHQHQQQPQSFHQQQPSGSNGTYPPQQQQYGVPQQQQQQQYQSQVAQQQAGGIPWQPYQQFAPGQYVHGQPSVTPVPQFGAYPPPPPAPTPWH